MPTTITAPGASHDLPAAPIPGLAAAAATLPALPRLACAQAFPAHPVRIIVPVPAGGALDIIARLIGQCLAERMGQTFIIENRPGAGTNIGIEAAVRAPADGYTLLLVPGSVTVNATLNPKLPFKFISDIVPIAMISELPLVMEVNLASPPRRSPSSSPTPRPIPASSALRRAASARLSTSPASCSS